MEGNNKPAINSSNGWWIVIIVFVISAGIKIKLSLNSRNTSQNNGVVDTVMKMDTSRKVMQVVTPPAQIAQQPALDTNHHSSVSIKSDSSASTENKTNLPDYPNKEKIESDLIGQTMRNWKFDHLSEFQDMQIISNDLSNNYLNMTVDFKLKDEAVNRIFDSKVIIRYFKYENAWDFKDVNQVYYKEITNNYSTSQNNGATANSTQSNMSNVNNGTNVAVNLIFKDTFVDNSHSWPVQTTPDYSFSIQNNRYQMENYTTRMFYSVVYDKELDLSKNYSVTVRIWHVSGVTNYGYGISFAHKDNSNYYLFEIAAQGYYRVDRYSNGAASNIIPWTISNWINKGEAVSNYLAIRKNGATCSFYVNGKLLNTIENFDDSGGISNGFVVENKQKVAVEAMRIFQYN